MNNNSFDLKTHNGKLTISNPATGGHRTFSIKTQPADSKFAPNERVIALLTGSDNTASYTSFGFIQPNGTVRLFRSKSDGIWLKYADMVSRPDAYPSAEYLFEEYCIVPKCKKRNQAKYKPVRV